MVDTITWRTTDLTRWGSGLGSPLSKTQVDINFWVLQTRLLALEDHAATASVGIADFYINPSNPAQFFEVLTDSTQLGPFTLPQATWHFTNPPTGTWVSLFAYAVYDVFTYGNTLYSVLVAHTSAATFDPTATDGLGHDLYQVLFTIPSTIAGQTVTGTTFTPTLGYAGAYIRCTNSVGCTVTLPADTTTNFPLWTTMTFRDESAVLGGGGLLIDAFSPVHINPVHGFLNASLSVGSTIEVIKVGADSWDILGLMLPGSP